MASSGSIVCIIYAFGITVGVANSFLKLECDETHMGRFGQQSMLTCAIKQQNVNVRVVIWYKVGQDKDPLLVFQGKMKLQVPGYRFAEPSWNPNNMNLSMLIDNTKMDNEGDYECSVVTDAGEDKKITRLTVKARYNKPTIKPAKETQILNAESTLTCESSGGYPEGKLRWFDEHDKDWTQSSNMTIEKMDNGLFKISSQLPLYPGSTYEKYSCKVYDSNGDEEEKVFFEPNQQIKSKANANTQKNKETSFIAPVVVIGSLIVGLLLALLIYRRRNQNLRRPSTTPLMGHHDSVETQDPDVEIGDPEDEDQYKSQP